MEEDLGLSRLTILANKMSLRADEFVRMSDEEQAKILSSYLNQQASSIEQAKQSLEWLKSMLAINTKTGLITVDEVTNAKLLSFFKENM